MTSLDVSKNDICRGTKHTEPIEALSEALRANATITRLNIANNNITIKQAGALALAIQGINVLSVLTFSGHHNRSKPVTMKTSMTDADFSGKELFSSGAAILAGFLPRCQ
jgi:hypothetical protein